MSPVSRWQRLQFRKTTIAAYSARCMAAEASIDMKLREDVTLELKIEDYHGYRLMIDEPGSEKYDYSIGHVYGVDDSFFDGTVKLTPANHETV